MRDRISKGTDLAFEVSKQFLTLALGGVAFAIGITGSHPEAFGTIWFWLAIILFGLSIFTGFVFLMAGVSSLGQDKAFDVYRPFHRMLSIIQVLSIVAGASLLLYIHASSLRYDSPTTVTFEIHVAGKMTSMTVPAGSSVEAVVAPDNTVKVTIK
jgi:hypothetical protein